MTPSCGRMVIRGAAIASFALGSVRLVCPTTMARFSSLVAIAAVATVTSDALVPGADAARLGTWMMSSEFCPPRRACAAPLPPWHTALPVIERLGVVGRGVWAGWRAGGRECHDCCTLIYCGTTHVCSACVLYKGRSHGQKRCLTLMTLT